MIRNPRASMVKVAQHVNPDLAQEFRANLGSAQMACAMAAHRTPREKVVETASCRGHLKRFDKSSLKNVLNKGVGLDREAQDADARRRRRVAVEEAAVLSIAIL